MKGLTIIGVVLVLLGVLSFVFPVPHREEHSLKIGDAKIGVQTQDNQKLPPAVGIVLVVAGVGILVLGSRS
jgi:uncharacterized protein YjeT (DUF2065 family)